MWLRWCSEIVRASVGMAPETVYLGGGTPSGMAADDLRSNFASRFPGARDGKKPPSKLRRASSRKNAPASWLRAGINRVSLGVQSFVQRELARTGRKHTAEIVEREIDIAARGGTRRISISI